MVRKPWLVYDGAGRFVDAFEERAVAFARAAGVQGAQVVDVHELHARERAGCERCGGRAAFVVGVVDAERAVAWRSCAAHLALVVVTASGVGDSVLVRRVRS